MSPMGMKGGGGDNDNDDVQAAAFAAACLVLRATPVVAVAVVIVRWVLWLLELEHFGVKSAGFMSVLGSFLSVFVMLASLFSFVLSPFPI